MPKIKPVQTGAMYLRVPEGFLERIDAIAKDDYTTRSEWVRRTIIEAVKRAEKEKQESGRA